MILTVISPHLALKSDTIPTGTCLRHARRLSTILMRIYHHREQKLDTILMEIYPRLAHKLGTIPMGICHRPGAGQLHAMIQIVTSHLPAQK